MNICWIAVSLLLVLVSAVVTGKVILIEDRYMEAALDITAVNGWPEYELPAKTIGQCADMAHCRPGTKAFCYDGKNCVIIKDGLAAGYMGLQTPGWRCMSNVTCRTVDGTEMGLNQQVKQACLSTLKQYCSITGEIVTTVTSGTSDWKLTTFGFIMLVPTLVTFPAARDFCNNFGATLFSEDQPGDAAKLVASLKPLLGSRYLWVDLSKNTATGVWRWANGQVMSDGDSGWQAGYPVAGDQYGMLHPTTGELAASPSTDTHHFFCVAPAT